MQSPDSPGQTGHRAYMVLERLNSKPLPGPFKKPNYLFQGLASGNHKKEPQIAKTAGHVGLT